MSYTTAVFVCVCVSVCVSVCVCVCQHRITITGAKFVSLMVHRIGLFIVLLWKTV